MNSERWQKIKSILEKALEIAPAARAAFLDEVCRGDKNLRREVEALLAFDNDDEALEEPAFSSVVQELFSSSDDFIGKRFGNYRILEKLGEGGMGAVFLADRDDGEFF